MHNTFSVELQDSAFTATSHNFPEFSGEGLTAEAAIESMNRKIIQYMDNNKAEYNYRIKERLSKGLACLCGEKLTGGVLAVYKGRTF